MRHIAGGRASPSRARYFWLAACPVAAGAIAIAMSIFGQTAGAATAVDLGTAGTYAVLASTAVTNTGPTILNGDLGLSPDTASSVTGFGVPPDGTYTGAEYTGPSSPAAQAQLDLTTAYNVAAGESTTAAIPGTIGVTTAPLVPGVYTASSSLLVNGALTLNAQGDPDAVWIFKVGSALTTATISSVVFVNDPAPADDQACNLFWQVTSSATINGPVFAGTIMAQTSISVGSGVTISGRALASTGAVTLDDDAITPPGCDTTTPTTPPPSPSTPPTTTPPPSPSTTPTTTPPPSPSTTPTSPTTTPPPSPTSPPTSPTSSATHPAPSPTGPASPTAFTSPTASTGPTPAPTPSPVPTTFPVTG